MLIKKLAACWCYLATVILFALCLVGISAAAGNHGDGDYAAGHDRQPSLLSPRHITVEEISPLVIAPSSTTVTLITLQANNIQVRAKWQVSNAINAFAIDEFGDGVLYLTATMDNAILVATVYVQDDFQLLNSAYDNLVAMVTIRVEIMADFISLSVCDRTPQVRAEILTQTGKDCALVTNDDLATITVMNINDRGITSLQAGDFAHLQNLTRLDLDNNTLTVLANGVFAGLRNLQAIDLHNNALTTLPIGVFDDLVNLQDMDLSSNNLMILPRGLFAGLHHLQELDLQDNACSFAEQKSYLGIADSLPAQFSDGNDCQILPQWANFVSSITMAFPSQSAQGEGVIINLALRYPVQTDSFTVSLTVISEGAGSYTLTIWGDNFNLSCADELCVLTIPQGQQQAQLSVLTAKDMTLSLVGGGDGKMVIDIADFACARTPSVRDEILARVEKSDCALVTRADLAGITEMNLANKNITSLPASDFDRLDNLHTLYLQNNALTTLPNEMLVSLRNLRRLDLSHNNLTFLADNVFAGLDNLQRLYLHNNNLVVLVDGVFADLDNVEILELDDNALMVLPASLFANLDNLQRLDLQDNVCSFATQKDYLGIAESVNFNSGIGDSCPTLNDVQRANFAVSMTTITESDSKQGIGAIINLALTYPVQVDSFTVSLTVLSKGAGSYTMTILSDGIAWSCADENCELIMPQSARQVSLTVLTQTGMVLSLVAGGSGKLMVAIMPAMSLSVATVPLLLANAGIATHLYAFDANGGIGAKTYNLLSDNEIDYFILVNGVLSLQAKATQLGKYTLAMEVADSAFWVNKITVAMTVEIVRNQMYVLGGDDGGKLNDVWSSLDGQIWELEKADNNMGWSERYNHQALSHHGRLYVLGGYDTKQYYNDVWSSVDGQIWSLVKADNNVGWSKRGGHQVLSHHGRLYVLGGFNGSDRFNDVWSSVDGQNWSVVTSSADWQERWRHQSVSYNGMLYVLGGDDGGQLNDVWSSVDGKSWSLVKANNNMGWLGRSSYQALSYNGRLYVLGGYDGGWRNDVWSSADGQIWRLEKADNNVGWLGRRGHQVLSYNERLYMLGGSIKNDVWSSVDGKVWSLEKSSNNEYWSRRIDHQSVVFPPDLLLDGVGERISVSANETKNLYTLTARYGVGDYTYSLLPMVTGFDINNNGVLSATGNANEIEYTLTVWVEDGDGTRAQTAVRISIFTFPFLLATVPPLFAVVGMAENLHTLVASGGIGAKNYNLVGGNKNGYFAVFSGVLSVQEQTNKGRYTLLVEISDSAFKVNKITAALTVEVVRNQMYVLGGVGGGGLNDVWSSVDGKSWLLEKADDNLGWSGRSSHQALSHNGRLYVLGGHDDTDRLNDVWSSVDGKSWSLAKANNNVGWPGRSGHQALSHNGRLYVLGGWYDGTDGLNDVWSSVDGKSWSLAKANNNVGWPGRGGHQALSHNGRLYVLGGHHGTDGLNDVWSSVDGKNWLLEKADDNLGWSGRSSHQALSHNGRLYVLGGSPSYFLFGRNDVWSSVDGKNWALEKASNGVGWSWRWGHQTLSRDGRIYVLGGGDGSGQLNDVWSSVDGKIWSLEKANNNVGWSPRYSHQAIVFPPNLLLVGVGERISLFVGETKNIYTLTAQYGADNYTYSLLPTVTGFDITDNGILSATGDATEGEYTLTVWVEDGEGTRAQTAVRVEILPSAILSMILLPSLFTTADAAMSLISCPDWLLGTRRRFCRYGRIDGQRSAKCFGLV